MDAEAQDKIHAVMAAAAEDAKRRGLSVQETMQAISDALVNHHDPDVIAFGERHNRHVRRDLN